MTEKGFFIITIIINIIIVVVWLRKRERERELGRDAALAQSECMQTKDEREGC